MATEELLEDDIDLETLQAQIDLSMAHTKDVVASWIKPSRPSSVNMSRTDGVKDLEDLLRRPPRLGVGAAIPASTGTFGIEAVKLKNKLSGKKRAREDEEISALKGKVDSDDEESRGSMIKKKAKVEPFADGKGKKKNPFASPVSRHPIEDKGGPSKTQDMPEPISVDAPRTPSPSSPRIPPAPGVSSLAEDSGSPRKKKKKKSKLEKDTQSSDAGLSASAIGTTSALPKYDTPSSTSPIKSVGALPLLNLDGPPPLLTEQSPSSPSKRKRKKRKKKKKGDVIPEEGQAS